MTEPAAVAAYVGAVVVANAPVRVTEIARFPAGENHAVYRVTYLDGFEVERDAVVRAWQSGSESDRAQARREAAVLARLPGGVGPQLLDFQAHGPFGGRPIMCLDYVAGHFETFDTADTERLAKLGAVVRRTNSLDTSELATILDGEADMATYVDVRLHSMLARLPLVRDPLPRTTQARFKRLAGWAGHTASQLRAVGATNELALLHGDVSAGNVLWTPEPVLIDWEYARIGDPADEVGYLFGQNAMKPAQRRAFWRGYGDGMSPAALTSVVDRTARWEPLTLFGSALYWIDLWSRRITADAAHVADLTAPKEPGYYLGFADRYLNRCEQIGQQVQGLSAG